jgi:hypothetical protein
MPTRLLIGGTLIPAKWALVQISSPKVLVRRTKTAGRIEINPVQAVAHFLIPVWYVRAIAEEDEAVPCFSHTITTISQKFRYLL